MNREMRGANGNALETISAAATAIASAENRVPPASVQKRRWGSCWSVYWCFGSQKQSKRIGHADLVPEATVAVTEVSAAENPIQAPTVVLPFVAPPSSPASFLPSEPPSATQSPAGLLSFTSTPANMYSPGPANIFAIGPYAHETQLVSPPVFSTFTTEPSTAPFTPPPESVQLTTPSSPEVPFARLLDPHHQNGEAGLRFPMCYYEFQTYQFQPGSPVSHLISPGSAISGSGASSPFPDGEFTPGGTHFIQFRVGEPPKLLNLEKLAAHDWGSRQESGSLTPDAVLPRSRDTFPLNRQNSDVAPLAATNGYNRGDDPVVDHRVSFEITAEDVVRCLSKDSLAKAVAPFQKKGITANIDENSPHVAKVEDGHSGETSNDPSSEKASAHGEDCHWPQRNPSITLGSSKEFNFDNMDGGNSDKPSVGSDWWANETLLAKESGACKDWSFFPMMQPGVS